MNENKIFDIEVECDGVFYKGWANPSDKLNVEGLPSSFHVVLNEVSFGYLSFNDNKWIADEPRPAPLIEAVGREIEKQYQGNKNK